MPLCPGTGIPYGRSPFAFSAGTVEARCTVTAGVIFSSLTGLLACSGGVGDAWAGFRFRELGRRDTRFVFFSVGLGVGRGWKAFETDWPTFLKKSPTGSAFTDGPLANNSAATGNQSQRRWKKNVIRSSAFNDEAVISVRFGTYWKQKISLLGDFCRFLLKWIMQSEQLRCIADQHDKDFGVIVIRNADRCGDPKRF